MMVHDSEMKVDDGEMKVMMMFSDSLLANG